MSIDEESLAGTDCADILRLPRYRPEFGSQNSAATKCKLFCFVVAAQLLVSGADAHSWYPKGCCSDNECQRVPCAEITRTHLGLEWRLAIFEIRHSRP